MEKSTALALDKLPICQTCPDNRPGESYCNDEKCPNTNKYYCEVCAFPDANLHLHANFKTVLVNDKFNKQWTSLMEECVNL